VDSPKIKKLIKAKKMSKDSKPKRTFASTTEDYYLDDQGRLVFTAKYHLKRGYCCQNGCKHCPYGFKK